MTTTPMLFIAVEFCDGSKIKYSFPVQAANAAARQMKLEDLLKGRHLVIQAEGRLIMHPMENIKTHRTLDRRRLAGGHPAADAHDPRSDAAALARKPLLGRLHLARGRRDRRGHVAALRHLRPSEMRT